MGSFSKFWWNSIRDGARGSVPFANDWQWTIGNPTVAAITPTVLIWLTAWLGAEYVSAEHPILAPLAVALAAFVVTWLVAAVVGALRVAPQRYYNEKARADKLEERLRPKLRISFDKKDRGCLHETRITNGPKLKLASVRIDATGIGLVHDCGADLVSLSKDDGGNLLIQGLPLIISPAERPNHSRKDVREGRPELVNILGIDENNSVRLWTENFYMPNYLAPITELGIYRILIRVFGSETAPSSIELSFNWTGNWQTAEISLWPAENI